MLNDNSLYSVQTIPPQLYEDMPRIAVTLFSGDALLLSPNMPLSAMRRHITSFLTPYFLSGGQAVLDAMAASVLANVSKLPCNFP